MRGMYLDTPFSPPLPYLFIYLPFSLSLHLSLADSQHLHQHQHQRPHSKFQKSRSSVTPRGVKYTSEKRSPLKGSVQWRCFQPSNCTGL